MKATVTAGAQGTAGRNLSAVIRPGNVPWRIMALLILVNMLPSLGKISMGITAKNVQAEFALSATQMGWILGAFALGYALFQVPAGWAADRFGPRIVLTASIIWYSLCSASIAFAPQFLASRGLGIVAGFCVLRFLVGVGEAFTPPSSARVVASWMSSQKLAFGISFTLLGVGAGGAFTPTFIAWTAQHWGWRTSFLLCGLLGLLVSLVWALYATNRPAEPASNYDPNVGIERQLSNSHRDPRLGDLASTRVPWRKIFGSGSVWALLLSYMCRAYAMFFFDTWFFIYLVKVRGLTVIRGGLWASTPYLAVLLFSPFGGLVSDFAVNRFGRRRGRQAAVWLGMACSGILVLIGCHTANNAVAILLVAAAAGFNMFANVTWWATCIDVMPNHAASLAGLMNMCGGIAGLIAPILTAYIATSFGWAAALDFIAILCAAGGLLWIFVNAEKQLEEGATLTLEEQNAKSIS